MNSKNTSVQAAKLISAAVVAAASALTVQSVTAQTATTQDSAWYVGGNVGRSMATVDNARITSGLAGAGLATNSITDRDRTTGFKIYGGYQLNPNFALESGYFDLGKFGFTANTSPAGTLNGDIRVRGLNLDLVGTLPLSEQFSLLGRVGANFAQTRGTFSGTGAVGVANPNPSKRETNYKIGVGLQYAFTESLSMRGELERYRINDAVGNKGHVDMLSVGLVYKFGGKTQSPPPVAPRTAVTEPVVIAAAPVVVTPPPPPAPVTPPPPVKVSFSADSLFDFDKSAVKPAGKQALDKFAADLKNTQYDAVKVTGHTDRLGSPAYNQKLSSRRADAVNAYLVESAGVASNKIAAQGVSGANPVTKPGDCKGNKPTAKLIACLQPDRRVEVEVTGFKPSR